MPHSTEVVASEEAWKSEDPMVLLTSTLDVLKASSQIAGNRLNAIWNPETRKYEPREEMVALHGIINENLRAYSRVSRAIRLLS